MRDDDDPVDAGPPDPREHREQHLEQQHEQHVIRHHLDNRLDEGEERMSAFDDLDQAMEDLEGLLLDVLGSVLSEDAVPCWDQLPPGPQAVAHLAIHDHAEGEYLGITVRLGMPLARVLASRMMTVADPTAEDVVDAVGELGNIAGGNVKSLLCQHARLSLPTAELVEAGDPHADGVQVRAVVLGQVVELTLAPGRPAEGLAWPPENVTEAVDA